jgi:hypothetical protein
MRVRIAASAPAALFAVLAVLAVLAAPAAHAATTLAGQAASTAPAQPAAVRAAPTQPAAKPAAPAATLQFLARRDQSWDQWQAGEPIICMTAAAAPAPDCFSFLIQGAAMTVYGQLACKDNDFVGLCKNLPAVNLPADMSAYPTLGTYPINQAQRQRIIETVAAWNARQVVPGSCEGAAFANQVARAAGLRTPRSSRTTTPYDYVVQLVKSNPIP